MPVPSAGSVVWDLCRLVIASDIRKINGTIINNALGAKSVPPSDIRIACRSQHPKWWDPTPYHGTYIMPEPGHERRQLMTRQLAQEYFFSRRRRRERARSA